ncbi:MAG TPA: DUF1491 family protein [Stellaceae bacterium]|nr:DUF1491 family protein [Stellaceae bacterium]
MEARLKTGIWVKALIRRCDLAATPAAVIARGDPDAGAVLLRFDGRDGTAVVVAQTRQPDGALVWLRSTGAAPVAGADADAYIERQRRRDPDLWVIEIETAMPETVLDEPVIG